MKKKRNWIDLDGEHDDTWYEKLWSFADDNLAFNPRNKNQEYIITPPPPCKSFDTSTFLEKTTVKSYLMILKYV